jgi:hypothetical protein
MRILSQKENHQTKGDQKTSREERDRSRRPKGGLIKPKQIRKLVEKETEVKPIEDEIINKELKEIGSL